ncbi:hypothetical protein EVAR_103652_1 [Eumeta japonica]|uniref:Uncharacterized protein n=1 Tax=Eumeta variegata TaxID=151549 RepID=A0A4C1Z550_EUMVA|nr:hypothetical protein EVAR_103652_1 [Eumeta japonica]
MAFQPHHSINLLRINPGFAIVCGACLPFAYDLFRTFLSPVTAQVHERSQLTDVLLGLLKKIARLTWRTFGQLQIKCHQIVFLAGEQSFVLSLMRMRCEIGMRSIETHPNFKPEEGSFTRVVF